jgi:Cell Wall Hydrolase
LTRQNRFAAKSLFIFALFCLNTPPGKSGQGAVVLPNAVIIQPTGAQLIKSGAGHTGGLLVWLSISLLACFGAAITLLSVVHDLAPPFPSTARIALKPLDFVPQLPQAMAVAGATTTTDAIKDLLTEHRCLSEVMYYEARGEGEEGEHAVAQVVFGRLAQGGHGKTICDVVYEGVGETFCQFTFACDGSMDRPKDPKAWRMSQILAARLMARELGPIGDIKGATNFHAARIHPSWASGVEKIAKIGNHIFYRAKSLTVDSPVD